MSESTSILDLPTDPVGGGNVGNGLSLNASENVPSGVSLDQTTINQIVSGLQQASINGSTQLPSRDIPMTTSGLSSDPQVRPNYVPPPPANNVDYIQNYEQSDNMVNNYNRNMRNNNSLDDIYNEIQTPLLLAIMYFLFQLPFFRKFLFTYLPVLFSIDGNFNINGYLFTSILFGALFFIVNKTSTYFNAF